MTAPALGFACRCGKLTGRIAPGRGSHVICYCRDCRAAARHLDADSAVTPQGGVPLYQTRPDWVHFEGGVEHLACLRLSPKGLLRWYAACCDTPLANTLATPKLPFASLSRAVIEQPEALGPVIAEINTGSAPAGVGAPARDRGMARAVLLFLGRATGAWLTGRARRNAFFGADRTPVVTPQVLSREQRERALAG